MKRLTRWHATAAASAAVLGLLLTLCPMTNADSPGVRQPYLQNDQGTSVTICWTTAGTVPSQVAYRRPGEPAEHLAGSPEPAIRHEVALDGLDPGSQYEYRVTTDAGASSWFPFSTRPEGPVPFRFAVTGDVGEGSAGERAVARLLQQEAPHFAVALGDLAYPSGRERTLTSRFFRPLAGYSTGHVVWHVFGNHDVDGDGGRPLDLASVTPANGPPGLPPDRTYSFDYGPAHFVVLDSNLPGRILGSVVRPWLERDLQATDRSWKFVMTHHPPFSTGRHGSARKLQRILAPTFAAGGVAIVFSGHDHDYQRFRPINGVTYVVSGNGGAGLYRFKRSNPNIAFRDDTHHGLTVLDVVQDRLVLRHVKEDDTEIDSCVLTRP
jgi:hypothetical protein